MYPIDLTAPMSADLNSVGFESLRNAAEVDSAIANEGTTLVVVNSVCGCAAAMARPAAKIAIQHSKRPDKLVTVFAGVDQEATNKAREYMLPYPPSSPSIALFKDGKLVHLIERRHIEGRSAEMIAGNLTSAFDMFC